MPTKAKYIFLLGVHTKYPLASMDVSLFVNRYR